MKTKTIIIISSTFLTALVGLVIFNFVSNKKTRNIVESRQGKLNEITDKLDVATRKAIKNIKEADIVEENRNSSEKTKETKETEVKKDINKKD